MCKTYLWRKSIAYKKDTILEITESNRLLLEEIDSTADVTTADISGLKY